MTYADHLITDLNKTDHQEYESRVQEIFGIWANAFKGYRPAITKKYILKDFDDEEKSECLQNVKEVRIYDDDYDESFLYFAVVTDFDNETLKLRIAKPTFDMFVNNGINVVDLT